MLLLIPLLPFVGFLLNASFGRRVSTRAAGAIACGAMLASLAVSALAVAELVARAPESRSIAQPIFTWITSGDLSVNFTLRLDPLSALMILVVTGIGSLIHIYSTAYMHEESDSEFARYFSYLNLFAAFMLVLVLGSNFLVMFVGWEGVGLCSYLLIGFWYQKKSASDAGKKAFIVNRIGDVGFVLGVLLIFVRFGTLDFQEIARSLATLRPETTFGTLSLITLLLFVGATGKSAQIPLHIWLPDAMEGPTPVSALIHAATMVTAGVYMIGRNAVLFSHAPETLTIVAVVGVVTALLAGTIGLVQNDIKRVLAYSTVSQLGYMFLAMGVGAYAAGIFHLYTHAFFKALLFLGAGAVIHALGGEQDLRRMGGLKKELPITYRTFLIGALAIAGFPGLAGFFSKDEILYRTYAGGHAVLWTVGLLTSMLTAIYMFRLVFLAFHGERQGAQGGHGAQGAQGAQSAQGAHLHDAPSAMAFVLIVLAIGSVVAGWVGLPGGSSRIERFLEPSFTAGEVRLKPDTTDIGIKPDTTDTGIKPGTTDTGIRPDTTDTGIRPDTTDTGIKPDTTDTGIRPDTTDTGIRPDTTDTGIRPGTTDTGIRPGTKPDDTNTGSVRLQPDQEGAAAATKGLEFRLMGVSTVVALGGIGLATFFFLQRRRAADELAERFAGLHRVLVHKYYVDEIYDATVVQPIQIVSREGLWKGVDVRLIDGAVNGVGEIVGGGSESLRRLQSGSVRAYAASIFFGVVLILGYYLWR